MLCSCFDSTRNSYYIEKIAKCVIVVKRLAYTHHGYITNRYILMFFDSEYLTYHFAGGKVTLFSEPSAATEFAAHIASALR